MELLSVRDKAVLDTIFDPLQPQGLDIALEQNSDSGVDDKLEENVTKLLKEAVACTEGQRIEDALRLFDGALDKAPHSPSILNDRAQALRLAGRDEEALRDLDLAIKLSEGRGEAGRQALCQRGVLYRRMGQEEDAKADFEKAAKGGSKFARSQLVALNPYAALCNAMLQNVFAQTTD